MKYIAIGGLLLIAAIVSIVYFAHKSACIAATKELVAREADELLVTEDPKKHHACDIWNRELRYYFQATPTVKLATVVSSGPDGIFKTDDDIFDGAKDRNMSRVAGEWLGKRSKEGVKGFWDGLWQKSDFPKK